MGVRLSYYPCLHLIGHETVIIVIDGLIHSINPVNQRATNGPRISAGVVLTTLCASINAAADSHNVMIAITTPETRANC